MREIEFRGINVFTGTWIYGGIDIREYQVFIFDNTSENNTAIEVFSETVGQYTGLRDNKGNKAFEGDYIIHHHPEHNMIGIIKYGEYMNPIEWNDGRCIELCGKHVGFYIEWYGDTKLMREISRKDLTYWLKFREIEGNIHDNPELLK